MGTKRTFTGTILALIPARAGSKGVLDKNILPVGGYPLLAYSIAAAVRAVCVDRVMVTTDSAEYAAIAQTHGAEVPFLRPSELATDNSGDIEYIRHALSWITENEGAPPDTIVLLRPTTPLRDPDIIDDAIHRFARSEKASSLRSVHEMPETAYKTVEMVDGFLKRICTGDTDMDKANLPRQQYSVTYQANGYVDIVRTGSILMKGRLFGRRTLGYETPVTAEIDTLEDITYLEYQIGRQPEAMRRLFGKDFQNGASI